MIQETLSYLGGQLIKAMPRLLRPRYGARQGPTASAIGGGPAQWMQGWTSDKHRLVHAMRGWCYVAVDKIATAVAMHAPNVSHVRTPDSPVKGDRSKWLRPWDRAKALTPLMSHEQLEPARPGHPLTRLLHDPNSPDTSYDFFYESVMYLCLTGELYIWAPPGGLLGRPSALWVIPSHWVFPHVDRSGGVDYYDLRPAEGVHAGGVKLPAEDVIAVHKKSPFSKYAGQSPLDAGSEWVDTARSIDRSRHASFVNGIFPGVAIEFGEGVRLPDDKDLDRIEARLMARYGGERNANKPIFVPPGATLRKMQLTPSELMYCESADQVRDNVLALFGVPASVAQVNSHMTYGSVLAAQQSFYALTLNPLFRMLGQQLTEKLAWRFDRGLKVWWEDKTPQDPELLERQLHTDLAYGARTMNEVRALRGLMPFAEAWGDTPWIPLNTLPIDEALKRGLAPGDAPGSTGANRATQRHPNNITAGEEQA